MKPFLKLCVLLILTVPISVGLRQRNAAQAQRFLDEAARGQSRTAFDRLAAERKSDRMGL